MIECNNCHKRIPTKEAFAWLLVHYRPTQSEYLNRVMTRHYNYCSVTCLVAFYTRNNVA